MCRFEIQESGKSPFIHGAVPEQTDRCRQQLRIKTKQDLILRGLLMISEKNAPRLPAKQQMT